MKEKENLIAVVERNNATFGLLFKYLKGTIVSVQIIFLTGIYGFSYFS